MIEPTSDSELWSRRSRSFGAGAADYAEHRPDYPIEAIRWGLPSGATDVVDLAAGTGKLTGNLLEMDLRVTAIEPDPGMLAELRRRHPGVSALDGVAEHIPLPDGQADAVLIGQAFHWFDLDRALTEIARVLKPGGRLVALWNEDDRSVPWVAAFSDGRRSSVSRVGMSSAPDNFEHEEFGPFEERTFRHGQRRTADSLLATIATHSHLIVIPEDERVAILARLGEFLAANPETAQGEFIYPLITTALRATRR
ncbi:class I SAM-dependent methyltransferase [Amycolatopsis pigmentata]|uniref:Class I SAM-dependent methyltransferase n=1 Tax=Amycolatopsis pigmentata TaxID=450801 RepID=A0ABW5FUP1_9PSEU